MLVMKSSDHHLYFSTHFFKNGQPTVFFTIENKKNIFNFLKELGYGYVRLDDKKVFFFRDEDKIVPVTFLELLRAFGGFLKSLDFSHLGLGTEILFDEYHAQQPIRNNGILRSSLSAELNNTELNELRLQLEYAAV